MTKGMKSFEILFDVELHLSSWAGYIRGQIEICDVMYGMEVQHIHSSTCITQRHRAENTALLPGA